VCGRETISTTVLKKEQSLKVLFSSRPAYGHLYPLMPLAMAFRDRGDTVYFTTGAEWVSRVQALGFETFAAGRSILWAEEEAIRRNPAFGELVGEQKAQLGAAMFSELLPPHTAEDLIRLIAEKRPDFVIYEGADFGAYLAAKISGVPGVFHSYGGPWPGFMIDAMMPKLHALWRSYGLEPPRDVMHGDAYLDISPPSIGVASGLGLQHRLPLRPVTFAEPIGRLPEWVKEQRVRPLVFVTLGTVVFERVDVIRAAVDGLAELDVDVLVAVGPEGKVEALGPLPERVHAELFVPQDQLLPHVDVIVHHCGSGTMLGGLSHGLPQVALPQGADQFINTAALSRSGAGLGLMPDEITPESIKLAVTRVLREPSFRQAAGKIEAEIQSMPSPDDVAGCLSDMFGGTKRP
jgi:UDP:flavonoid glycosyltransferase YjiC (YdhE family)